MTRRRRGRKARAAGPTPEELFAHADLIRRVALRRGVPEREVDDVVQETIISALRSIEAGRFTPRGHVDPVIVLRRWLATVALHHATHKLDKAYMRREMLDANPLALLRGWEEPPGATIELAEVLRVISTMRPIQRETLALLAQGHGLMEIAEILDIPVSTAANRIRYARDRLRVLLARERRRP